MPRRPHTPRPTATARATSAARAQAPAFDIFVRVALLAATALVLLFTLAASAFASTTTQRTHRDSVSAAEPMRAPSPQLTPDDVVATVLAALARNDQPVKDHGITVTFAFSSPSNRAFIGPVDSFAELVRDETYRPLLNHRSAARGVAHVNGDRATMRVVVTSATGARVAYLFALSLQNDGQYKGCWMTDGVTREPPSPLAGIRYTD